MSMGSEKAEKPKNPLILYMLEPSAPCRTVMLTATLAGVNLQYERVNVLQDEQMKPEFLQVCVLYVFSQVKILHFLP